MSGRRGPGPGASGAAAPGAAAPGSGDPERCARAVLETMPALMQDLRQHMRAARGPGLSVPQFRVLALLDRRPGSSLGDAAAHVGLGAPAMSALVEGLVRRRLVRRAAAPDDRRRAVLTLSAAGTALLAAARDATRRRLAARLAALPAAELAGIEQAMRRLLPLFAAPAPDDGRVTDG